MKIQTINSIELSSICNLSCPYCPARLQSQHRETGFMNSDVFKESIKWVRYFAEQGTQKELNLFGIGEPTLHPGLVKFVEYAHDNLPLRIKLHLNTNGLLMSEGLARSLKEAGIDSIDITGHDSRATVKTIRIFEKIGITCRVSFDAVVAPNNWAGQVDWFEPNYPKPYPCPWIGNGQVMVMSNGDITRCCIDAFGTGVMGNVFDNVPEIETTPFKLCDSCHHTIDHIEQRKIIV